jgi:hypothetical protein
MNLKIAHKTNNTISRILSPEPIKDKYQSSGAYQLQSSIHNRMYVCERVEIFKQNKKNTDKAQETIKKPQVSHNPS